MSALEASGRTPRIDHQFFKLCFSFRIAGALIKCPDYIAVVNGVTGNVLQLTGIPDQGSLSVGPLLKGSGDGSTLVLYSTKGINGSLFMASLKDIASGRKDLVSPK